MLGKKVKAIWGAMYPTAHGRIVKVKLGGQNSEAIIEWDEEDLAPTTINIDDIKPAGSGNAVGVYFEKEFMGGIYND